ncbi:ferredoxin-NADPH reductase [Agromyces seonyuensis]|uniref:Ferredoxin-NADPH reductase n=1 Tax=Agromyces seonyuensis TaxID=2662446 RepID=A0A6I4NWD1_9MICO|nr:ferredoxin-NADPH reductase [Agromyces seonyuensis]MWB98451.1 ferredoxin-NADPH reductase [Agromyces seonyuensis]
MQRVSHQVWAGILGFVSLVLVTNLLLVVACLPLVLLLMTTDPALSWPWIALATPLAAPGVAAAFRAFREHGVGGLGTLRAFGAGLRDTWRRALVVGAGATALAAVLLVDVRALSGGAIGVLVVPLLAVLVLVTCIVALLALVGLSEAPTARWSDLLRASAVLGLRRWYLSAVSLAAFAAQAAVFTTAPALGLGITASVVLYLAWTNSRFTLRPVLDLDEAVAA